eukprot:g10529.t1
MKDVRKEAQRLLHLTLKEDRPRSPRHQPFLVDEVFRMYPPLQPTSRRRPAPENSGQAAPAKQRNDRPGDDPAGQSGNGHDQPYQNQPLQSQSQSTCAGVDVVFVHGLCGDAVETWMATQPPVSTVTTAVRTITTRTVSRDAHGKLREKETTVATTEAVSFQRDEKFLCLF